MSQSKMIWKRLVVIVSIAFLPVVFYVMINRMKQQRNYAKYDKTVSEITVWANRYEPESKLPIPNSDAWGRPITMTKNKEQMIIMSQGADTISTNDDIILIINIRSGGYTVNYSFDSKNYFSGVYY